MENCPVTLKDKFKLETAIDDFNLCTLCEKEEKLLCQKLLFRKKKLKHNSPSTRAIADKKVTHTEKI